jgi:hypothetical protein
MLPVYLIQAGTAKEICSILREYAELIGGLCFTPLAANPKPFQGIFVGIAVVAPGHPLPDGFGRFSNGSCECGRVSTFERAK